jgi:hypothetical protein
VSSVHFISAKSEQLCMRVFGSELCWKGIPAEIFRIAGRGVQDNESHDIQRIRQSLHFAPDPMLLELKH